MTARCRICGRPLTSDVSQRRGTGPHCDAKTRPPSTPTPPTSRTDDPDHAALTAGGQLTIPTPQETPTQ